MSNGGLTTDHMSKQQESNQYRFSIIIPVLNEAEQINSLIEHIRSQGFERCYEIIVVDDDPQGSTVKAIQDRDVIAITTEKGRGRQMNAGAAGQVSFWPGMGATIVVTIFVTRIARKALKQTVPKNA